MIPALSSPIGEADLIAWLVHAKPGDRFTYWRGHLASDAWPLTGRLPEGECRRLGSVGRLAWNLAGEGFVHLVQERLGPNRFAYVVIARPHPPGRALPSPALLPEAA